MQNYLMFDQVIKILLTEIQDNLLVLKSLVNEKLPQLKVWLSTPTLRTDNEKATLTVTQLVNHLLRRFLYGKTEHRSN